MFWFYRLTIGSQCGKISYKTGSTERGSLFDIEKCHDIDIDIDVDSVSDVSDDKNEDKDDKNEQEYRDEGKIVIVDEGRNVESSQQESGQIYDDNDNNNHNGDDIDVTTKHKSKHKNKNPNKNENNNNKYRLKSLLSSKNTNISNFTPYLYVRSDGQLSCEVNLKNKNELLGLFYLKIEEFNLTHIGMKNDDSSHNNSNDNHDQVCYNDDNSNNDDNNLRSLSDVELKEFYENGFLKVSNCVDRSRINSCLRHEIINELQLILLLLLLVLLLLLYCYCYRYFCHCYCYCCFYYCCYCYHHIVIILKLS